MGEAASLVAATDSNTLLDSVVVRQVDSELRSMRAHYPQLSTIHGWEDGATLFVFAPYLLQGDDTLRFASALRAAVAGADTVGDCIVLHTTGVPRVDSAAARFGVTAIRASALGGGLNSLFRSPRYLARVVMTFPQPVRAIAIRSVFSQLGFADEPFRSITCWCEPIQSVTWKRTPRFDEFRFDWRPHPGVRPRRSANGGSPPRLVVEREWVVRVDRRSGTLSLVRSREVVE